MKSWSDFSAERPELAEHGRNMFLRSREHVGLAFIATLRKDGAPRLHPISLVISKDHLYVVIPLSSPKCADLIRDDRYALQAYPSSPNESGDEFYLAGHAHRIQDPGIKQALLDDTKVVVEEIEALFELFIERAMYTELANRGSSDEHPIHRKWMAPIRSNEKNTCMEGEQWQNLIISTNCLYFGLSFCKLCLSYISQSANPSSKVIQ